MYRSLFIIALLTFGLPACQSQSATKMTPHTNQLIHESSPYLLQHAHNPVDWYPWGNTAWEKAKKENKLVIVSIGYSACHWCHVMEHESFEDSAVADLMNQHFVSIKVDREERPDVDQIYMDAVQLITGRGGWPLNAICLPDGRPVYAGTYFQKEQWMQVLNFLQNEFETKRAEMDARAEEIHKGIKAMDIIPKVEDANFSTEIWKEIWKNYETQWDFEYGGRMGAPKFPMPANLDFMLAYSVVGKNSAAEKAVTITLDKMLEGGIYDHVGGGFARYSVDDMWHIPHFEKMLYDNAQLIEVYSLAYQRTKKAEYKAAVYNTIAFLERELKDASGGYYSALDADSEGEEGKFYVWEKKTLKALLGNDFTEFEKRFDISENGNFEGANHLVRKKLEGFGTTQEQQWMKLLLDERAKRIRPGLDDKILTSWNALLMKGFAVAYSVFQDDAILNDAKGIESFFQKNTLKKEGSVTRTFKNGKSAINGFLEDYSLMADAYSVMYKATFDESYLTQSKLLCDYAIQHFYNPANGLFYFTSINDDPLIARKVETSDNVIPSSNAVMADVLFQLGELYDDANYKKMSRQMLLNMQSMAHKYTSFYSRWAKLELSFIKTPSEIAIVGKDAQKLRQEFAIHYLPNVIFLGTNTNSDLPLLHGKHKSNETLIYVCENKTCGLPVKTVNDALLQLK